MEDSYHVHLAPTAASMPVTAILFVRIIIVHVKNALAIAVTNSIQQLFNARISTNVQLTLVVANTHASILLEDITAIVE